MQHVRVAIYQFKPGKADEAIRRAEAGAFPMYRGQPGFVGYGLIKTGEDSGISLSVWQTREQAEAAIQLAASWVRECRRTDRVRAESRRRPGFLLIHRPTRHIRALRQGTRPRSGKPSLSKQNYAHRSSLPPCLIWKVLVDA